MAIIAVHVPGCHQAERFPAINTWVAPFYVTYTQIWTWQTTTVVILIALSFPPPTLCIEVVIAT